MFSQTELIYSIACTVYVATCLMFAAVRWFHVCPTTRKQKDYYYPARRVVTLIYLSGIALLPYAVCPTSRESWLLAKSFLPLTNFYFCAVLMLTYFGKMKHWIRWLWPGRVATALTYGSLSVLLAVALWPGYHISEATERILTMMVIAVGLLMSLYCILAMRQVWLWIREFSYDNYSNPDDFPKRYAQRILFVPIIEAVLIVPMIVLDSPAYVAAVYMLLSVFNVAFLISILAPKRENDPQTRMLEDADEDEIEDSTEGEAENSPPQPAYTSSVEQPKQQKRKPRAIPEQTRQKIIDGIEDALTRRRLFLNPNLSLKDIAEVCGYGQTYVSSVFKAKYGGFYDHINMLRIRYADEYMRSHPDITKEEAICQSGFADRQSYYRIRKHLFPDEVQDEAI